MDKTTLATGDLSPAKFGYQPLVLFAAALAGGIVADRFWPRPLETWMLLAILSLVVWACTWQRAFGRMASIALMLAMLALGGAWHHWRWHLFAENDLGNYASEVARPVCVEVVAASDVRWSPAPPLDAMCSIPQTDESELDVVASRLRDGREWKTVTGQLTLKVDRQLLGVRRGDRLQVFGSLYRPALPRNPGEFDFAAHDRGQRRLCRLSCESATAVTVLERGSAWSLPLVLDQLRSRGEEVLRRHVAGGEVTLAAALILGTREPLDHTTTEGFFTTGVIHLLSISGLHVGILAYGFWWLARWSPLPRRWTLCLAAGLVVFYAVLTGGQPPVVRAAVLVVCVCLMKFFGRSGFGLNSLAAAALVVLGLNPTALFQTGAQLSFLAVATLSVVRIPTTDPVDHDPLNQLLERCRPWWVRAAHRVWLWLRQLILISLWVWLITLPLVWWRFHLVSPIALLLNPFIIPPSSVALYAGFLVLAIGAIAPPLAEPCGWICGRCLAFIQFCIEQSLRIHGNHLWAPSPSIHWVVGFYSVLIVLVVFPRLRPPSRWQLPLLLALLVTGVMTSQRDLWPLRRAAEQRRLTCTFVAVGHGTAVLLELPDGRTMLYDAGRLGPQISSVRPIADVLWSRGITHVDAIVLSHADTDHYNAVPQLLKRFSVGAIYVSPVMFRGESNATAALREAIETKQIPLREISWGDRFQISPDVRTEILHPSPRGVPGSDNANSIVLLLEFVGRRILLPGDLEAAGLDDFLAEEPIDGDIVMVPHHGSRRSKPLEFANWTRGEWAVISGGRVTDTTHVRDAYRQAGARVFHTAEDGAVRFVIDSQGTITAASWRGTGW